jgi:predicted RNA-binding Zn ribbon-like protein
MEQTKERPMIETGMHEEALCLESGRLCLDFANTAEWHASDQPVEGLNSYADLVRWSQSVGLLTEDGVQHLLDRAARRPADAAATLERAITLREALYRIFSAVAAGQLPQAADLDIVNEALAGALAHLQVDLSAGGFTWRWVGGEEALERMLWPVARSAADLLTSEDLDRVGECADDRGCGWLFMDESKNRSRQWCGPGCANRAKAQRHYARQKERRASEA